MSDGTKIEWTDATANVVNGCTVLSPGCKHCYAMRLAGTRMKHHPTREGLTIDTKAGPVWNGKVRFNEKALQDVLHWTKPRMIFWNAHGDLFHESVPDEWIDRCFAVMALTPQHKHQVLTKRSARMREYCSAEESRERIAEHVLSQFGGKGTPPTVYGGAITDRRDRVIWPLSNVWLGVSVEDQTRAEERIPDLLATPAAVRWISAEPLLGPLDLKKWLGWVHHHPDNTERNSPEMLAIIKATRDKLGGGIDWIVAGGESGPNARPMHIDWVRGLRDQCSAAGVAFLFKQWGEWFPYGHIDGDGHRNVRSRGEAPGLWHTWPDRTEDCFSCRIGKQQAGRLLDGVLHNGYPA